MSFNDFLGSWIPGSPLKLRPSQLKYMYSVFYCLLCVILVILSLLNIISTKSLLSLSLSVYIALAIIPTGQADLLNSPIPAPSWSSSCNITTNEGLNESHTDPTPLFICHRCKYDYCCTITCALYTDSAKQTE